MADYPVVGGREPCPCGSGRRYKACHGREASRAGFAFVSRPFEGLPGECDWVAMREIVPAARASVKLVDNDRSILIVTALPDAVAALHRKDGVILLGLQTPTNSGDASRDLASALLVALGTEPGDTISAGNANNTVRLQDLLDLTENFHVEVTEGFDFWFAPGEELSKETRANLDELTAGIVQTVRLKAPIGSAYWCEFPDRSVIRWVLDVPEELALDALARLSATGSLAFGEGSRYLGAFRAAGLLVPVWEVDSAKPARGFEVPLIALHHDFASALAIRAPLNTEERRARAGIVGRQLTLR